MEFAIPWQNLNIDDIQYGLSQNNTRIDDGLFVPIYYADKNVRCQAVHILTPELIIRDIESCDDGIYLNFLIPTNSDFLKKLKELDLRNLQEADTHKNTWWPKNKFLTDISYKTVLKTLSNGQTEWRLQIPDSGIFSCYDTARKSWYASNESGLQKRKWKILGRTSGLWINQNSFGMDWKLIGAFVI
jgi:hypothetical protein